MEARFLVDDLKLTPKDPEPPKVVAPPVATPAADPAKLTVEKNPAPEGTLPASAASFRERGSNHQAGRDRQRQGHFQRRPDRRLVSGPDGPARRRAETAGYKPSAADVQEFQLALQQEVAKLGY